MSEARRTGPAKVHKMRTQGDLHAVPESRARRETLEMKRNPETSPEPGEPVALGGSQSDRALASRVGRQPVLEAANVHPAGKGPPMPRREALDEERLAASMKPAASGRRRMGSDVSED